MATVIDDVQGEAASPAAAPAASPAVHVMSMDAGRTEDFPTFFGGHHASIVRALTLTLGDAELGRDAAAEGFARALPRWNKVAAYDNPSGWVYRVGLNWARSRRRKTIREVASRPAESVISAEFPDVTLAAALRSLSFDHRAVLVGKYYLDWSEDDLAAALDIAPGTVKSRLSRAREHLAILLEESHGHA